MARQQELGWGFPRGGNRRRGGRGGCAEGKSVLAWRNGVFGAFFLRDLPEKVQVQSPARAGDVVFGEDLQGWMVGKEREAKGMSEGRKS